MDWLAKGVRKGDFNAETEFYKHSFMVGGFKGVMSKLIDDKNNGQFQLNMKMYLTADLGGLVMSRCLAHLKNNDWEETSEYRKVWGLKYLKLFDQTVQNLAPSEVHLIPGFSRKPPYPPTFTRNKHTIRYTLCPNFETAGSNRDLERVCQGLDDIDSSDHVRYGCHHLKNNYAPPTEICRICFDEGFKRVKAVSAGAYAISKDIVGYDEKGTSGLYYYGVIYQTSKDQKLQKEMFVGYSKEEVNTILRLLSTHSADIDPRVVCLNQDLYWSVVWFYGSVYEAYYIGGQKLQYKGFGTHKKQNRTQMPERPESPDPFFACILQNSPELNMVYNLKKAMALPEPSKCPGKDKFANHDYKELDNLPPNHFMADLSCKSGEWRYVCGNEKCLKFEKTSKFLKCAGCKDTASRRYCSELCQQEDWSKHQEECDWKKK